MQATLKSCLAVVSFALLSSAPLPADHSLWQAPSEQSRFVEQYSPAESSTPPAAHTRLTNYLKAHWKAPAELAHKIVEAVHAQSEETGIPASLILAIIAKESSFRPDAKSGYGAQGLMQVVPRWHPEKLEERNHGALLDPVQNIEVGTQVLSEYVDKAKGNTRLALKKYSGGATSYYEMVRKYQATFEKVAESEPIETASR